MGYDNGYVVTRIGPKRQRKLFLAEWREKFKLTQPELAARLGVSKMTISRYENDRRGVNVKVLMGLAEALGIEPEDFYRHPDQPSADALLRDQPVSVRDQAIKVITALRKAN